MALVHAEPERISALSGLTAAQDPILSIEPEYFVYTAVEPPIAQVSASGIATWGLLACGVTKSKFTGKGIKVAVLDTGLDLTHPDFKGRSITTKSFVDGEAVQDGDGHGTHCTGTSCGPAVPPV